LIQTAWGGSGGDGGFLTKRSGWAINAPSRTSCYRFRQAIAEQNEEWIFEDRTVGGWRIIKRQQGEALHSAREDLAELQNTRKTKGE